jgi:hypothetical protein
VSVSAILPGAEPGYSVGVDVHSIEAFELGLELFGCTGGKGIAQGPVLFAFLVIFDDFKNVLTNSVQGHLKTSPQLVRVGLHEIGKLGTPDLGHALGQGVKFGHDPPLW